MVIVGICEKVLYLSDPSSQKRESIMMHMGDEAVYKASTNLFSHAIKYLENDGSETMKELRGDIRDVLIANGATQNQQKKMWAIPDSRQDDYHMTGALRIDSFEKDCEFLANDMVDREMFRYIEFKCNNKNGECDSDHFKQDARFCRMCGNPRLIRLQSKTVMEKMIKSERVMVSGPRTEHYEEDVKKIIDEIKMFEEKYMDYETRHHTELDWKCNKMDTKTVYWHLHEELKAVLDKVEEAW